MFQSATWKPNQYRFTCVCVVDSDFVEDVVADNMYDAIITVYGRRGLPVAHNLILLVRYLSTKYHLPFNAEIIQRIIDIRPGVAKYKDELEKYLLLM